MQKNLKFKVNNPYKPDELIQQEVIVSDKLHYNYTDTPWVSIDAEFLGLNLNRDALCSVQIASPDPDHKERQRVEILYTYNQLPDGNLIKLLRSNTEKIFHVFSSDMPMLMKYTGQNINSPIFDTKVASKIVWTNSRSNSKTNLVISLVDPRYKKLEEGDSRWELEPENWSDKMIEYAAKDVLYLHPVKLKLEKIAQDRQRLEILNESMKTLPTLAKLILQGYDLDVYHF